MRQNGRRLSNIGTLIFLSTAEKIFHKVQSLPEQVQEELLRIVEQLAREPLSASSNPLTFGENDPLYNFHLHATQQAQPLSDDEMDDLIYRDCKASGLGSVAGD